MSDIITINEIFWKPCMEACHILPWFAIGHRQCIYTKYLMNSYSAITSITMYRLTLCMHMFAIVCTISMVKVTTCIIKLYRAIPLTSSCL